MSADETGMRVFDPGHSAWVAANAGAGKTYTLTNRVARLLLDGARPEHILCLTYTKAAAAEMQDRLFDQLGRWSMLPDAELSANIQAIGGAATDAKALAAARRLFAQALETPGGLKVLTIHAFCQIVLSRFPIEAGVAPGFEVLDEAAAREMAASARRRVLERADGGDLTGAVSCLVVETSETALQRLLDTALRSDRRRLDRFFQSLGSADPIIAARAAHGLEPNESITDIAQDFHGTCDTALLREIAAWLGSGGKKDVERADQILNALKLTDAIAFFHAFQDIFLTGKGEAYASLAGKKIADAQPELLARLRALEARFLAADDRFRAARAAGCAGAALMLIQAVRLEYQQAKKLRGVLDYDDLILRTLQLLEKRDAAAWVLFKLDGGLDHILVDEAQDTSPEQWAIVRKLTEEFFAGSGRERKKLRTIFAVGDEKQSIFSFQGADPAQFEVNRAHFRSLVEGAGLSFADELLPMSRRSAPQILDFVDAVFADAAAREGLTSGGIAIRHLALRDTAKGRVEVWPSLKPVDAPKLDPWAPVNVKSEDSPIVRLAAALARQIKGWIGTRVEGHDRAIAPGDIMILLPRREPFGSAIIRQLKLLDVPVAGADRIVLAEQIAVMDLMALGRFVLLPEDDLNLAALLRSPLCGLSEDDLYALRHGTERGFWQELVARRNESVRFAAAADFLSDMLARADYAPPFEFYSHALIARDRKQMLLARLGAEAGDAIEEFLSLALEHEQGRTPSLQGFLHGLARGGDEIKRDMERGQGQVRVMTVHGAKGLEADIVVLPDTTSLPEAPSSKGHLLYTQDGILFPLPDPEAPRIVKAAKLAAQAETLREHRRLLYVALTRARDRLYICGFENIRGVKPQSWHALAAQAAGGLGRTVTRNDEEIIIHGEDADALVDTLPEIEAAPPLPVWATSLPSREVPVPRLIRPSDAVEEPPVFAIAGPDGARRFRRGLLIHALLARLPEIKPQNRSALSLKFLKGHGLEKDEAEKLAAETLAVLDDPIFAAAFAPGSQAEAGIVADLPQFGPGARVTGRIDRLAVTDDSVLIVDFKTNRPPPGDEAAVDPVYLGQMALYRAAAARLFPEKRIACALIWTDGPRLLRLSDAILDAQAAKIAARLDPGAA